MCDLAWRPGLAAFAPRGAAQLAAWLSAELGSPGLARLERFFEKLHRGERVTVYFLGDSVTRGSGAGHHCATCSGRPTDLHPWLNASSGPAGEGCTGFNASATRGGDTYAHCARVGSNRLHECRGSGPDASEAHTSPNSTAAELGEAALWCYPRNSWRCLVVHWLQHAWPGQVKVVISSKPLLFMAACFGRALGGTDLILHEQAVNGGGRMLCLQERILHAALARPDLAVLMLLWLPKTYHPTTGPKVLRQSQDGLAKLGTHYSIPTLAMTRAFAGHCEAGAEWCYDGAHKTMNSSLGAAGSLHSDLNHPNDGGHALFAAHVHALMHNAASRVGKRLHVLASAAPAPEPPPLPRPLYPVNMGLGLSAGGGAHAHDDGGLCVDVVEMAATATRNTGWKVVTEMTKSKVARLPALQADAVGAEAEWTLDVRGADWLIVTYMQSYVGFGAIELSCVRGCECRPHSAPKEAFALINASEPTARFSEPQWTLLDLSKHSASCVVRAKSVSALKFKLMLLSLIRVRPPGVADADAGAAGESPAGEEERTRRDESLKCFGVGGGFAINGRVRTTAPWEALTAS